MDKPETTIPQPPVHVPFAFYDLQTGEVLSRGHVPPDWLALQVPPQGQGRYDDDATPGVHLIKGGVRIKRRASAAEKRAAAAEATRTARQSHYPAPGNQLDVLWRLVAALPVELVTDEARAMLAQIQQVKADFPKAGE
ncbi:hypothetical protein IGB42_02625 [Andreprevotia sp. IGB-42]|uniref:hypothetical protein n=1 Tax=Andreprevotia sp. IGB-42 TaxID=2497473 RepID=UPI00135BB290|nr:hypothetical protein [Andreprevotia sp. IGB-42]KAF0812782.1 hypothetical protein IGB42_02625 [Andreprevotia sp. IGB-42]